MEDASRKVWREAEMQWGVAGGRVVQALVDSADAAPALPALSRAAFATLQTAAAIDGETARCRLLLREINAPAAAQSGGGPDRPTRPPGPDDESDGSDVQAALIAEHVRPGKAESWLSAGAHTAPEGTPRVVQPDILSPEECARVVAGGLVAMAGAFGRCGQTTLGISPALGGRILELGSGGASDGGNADVPGPPRPIAASVQAAGEIGAALPLLYIAVERARRRISGAFGVPLADLRVSDSTFTRLLPRDAAAAAPAPAAAATCTHGGIDVGVLRGDRFCYWRPHIDQARRTQRPAARSCDQPMPPCTGERR